MARQRDITIDREAILRAAFAVLDEAGLEGVTMRALAARLSVQAPALYWHVRDKAELTAMMAQNLYQRGRAGLADCQDAAEWLEQLGKGLVAILAQHRDAARLLAIASPLARPDDSDAQAMAAPLMALGFSRNAALQAQAAVLSLTLGWAIYHENAAMAAYLSQMFDLDASYAAGLQALVGGLVAKTANST